MTDSNKTGADQNRNLGLAGRTARAFIHSPLSLLLLIGMLGLGLIGLINTPRQEDPQISVPMIDIFVQYPGASASQVASLAVDPLQRIMSEIPGVKHVYSVSERGQGVVTVRFRVGEDHGESVVKVHDKLSSNRDKIPPDVMQPLVKPIGIDDVAVVTITLWSQDQQPGTYSQAVDDSVLRTLAHDILQRLKEVPDTGHGFVVGGRRDQIRVEVYPERLSGYGISLDQVAQTIRTANSKKSAGQIESGGTRFAVYTGSFLKSAGDIERLVVGTHGGAPIYVRDIAHVTQEPEDARQMVTYSAGPAYTGDTQPDHAPAVTIAIAKKIGTNGVAVANAILDKVESLKGRLIPKQVHVEITRNYGESARDKVNGLITKLFIATGAVTILVLFALGWRPALVVTIVIPVVILITIFMAWVMGYTIDRVSLFALIFSIGILVDDAIVVVENIYRRWLKKGATDTDTAIDAVREVGNPTILATFTVVAALLPMGLVRGLMGPYMEPIPALGSVAMLFSLFAAFAFTPWLAMKFKPGLSALKKAEEREHRANVKLRNLFRRILIPLLTSKRIGFGFLAGLILLFFAAIMMFFTTAVPVKMLPLDNKPEFSVVVDMPEGTALPVTANLSRLLANKLVTIEEVTATQTYVGTSRPFDFNGMVRHYYLRDKPWQADIQVQLLDKHERARSSHEIATAARELLLPLIAGTGAKISVVEMPPGPPVLQTVVAEIYGPDAETRRAVAAHMTQVFEQTDNLADVDNYMAEPSSSWRFAINTEKAVRRGISVDTINRNLAMAMGGHRLGDVKQGRVLEPTYIVIQVPLAVRSQIGRLQELPIPAADGSTVSLGELGTFVRDDEDPIIYQKDLRPLEYVVAEAIGRLGAPIYPIFAVEEKLRDYVTPDGVKGMVSAKVPLGVPAIGAPVNNGQSSFEWTGEWTVTYETFRDMGMAFIAALILIYVLVVWEFGNFVVPAIIMAPIPLTLLGIVPGHWLMGAEFTATSMIGFIALAGIIVRNSILLIDFTIQQVNSGVDIRDAVIDACSTRARPIVITALALVAGSTVIITDPIFEGMAISLLFGVLVSTILTLVVIPLGCVTAGNYLVARDDVDPATPDQPATARQRVTPGSPVAAGSPLGDRIVLLFQAIFVISRALLVRIMRVVRPQAPIPEPDAATPATAAQTSPASEPTPAQRTTPKPGRPRQQRVRVARNKPATTAKSAPAKKPATTGRRRGIRLKPKL